MGDRSYRRDRHQRREEPTANRTLEMLVRIGDRGEYSSFNDLTRKVDDLAHEMLSEMRHSRDQVVDLLFSCVKGLAFKTSIYGTVVGLLNAADSAVGKLIAARARDELQTSINAHDWNKSKLLLRFVAELVNANVVSASALVRLFDQLIAVASDPEASTQRVTAYAMLVIGTLPYVGRELSSLRPDDTKRVMRALGNVMSSRKPRVVPLNIAVEDDKPTDPVEDAWGRVRDMHSDDWAINCVFQIYPVFSAKLNIAEQHALSLIDIPVHSAAIVYPLYTPLIRIFSRTEVEQSMKPVERFVLADQIVDTLCNFVASYKDVGKQLATPPVPYTFEHLIVETILNELLALPHSAVRIAYYTAVCVALCKAVPSVPAVLARAMEQLFARLNKMDIECVDRFSEWFAHFVSNFDYKWSWTSWVDAVNADPESIHALFVRDTLARCVRLSYLDRVKQSVPAELWPLLPPASVPNYKFQQDERSALLKERLRARASAEDITAFLRSECSDVDMQRDLLLQTMLNVGEKSVSHVMTVLERNIALLKTFMANPGDRVRALQIIKDFWATTPQLVVILVDKFMTYQLVDSGSIVTWLFSSATEEFNSYYVWEILNNVIAKTIARTETVRSDLQAAQLRLSQKNRGS
eukprot:TRINITY_DN12782_c0_g1_i1.p1 TRINITY_DN12782_c0_g1~~TRINITY_DN12782_c0_g1_i1.p1  ORF type:complete len:650 (-),score=113.51 TRINITY_DN12782_c0_g1_i1:334-2244(-)